MATPGGEDTPLCFSGTLLVTGRAVGIVKVTGQHTEIGKIGKSLAGVKVKCYVISSQLFRKRRLR